MSNTYFRIGIRLSVLTLLLFALVALIEPPRALAFINCSVCRSAELFCENTTCPTYGEDSEQCANCLAAADNCFAQCGGN